MGKHSMKQFSDRSRKVLRESGMSLLETMVALVIFGSIVSAMMPLFVTFRLSTIKNDIKLGGIAVSQRVLDEIRQEKISTLPLSGRKEELPSGTSTKSMDYKGTKYRVEIEYCNPSKDCDAATRYIKVSAFHLQGTEPVFQVETIYTQLKNEA
jgi:prepilin-type N-terminal cleavage/methylation domain-containing protein